MGSRAPSAERACGPSEGTSSRIVSGEKYMTAEVLPSGAPSTRGSAPSPPAHRVAGEPVEAVGGEHGNAPGADAGSSASRAASAPVGSIETISITRIGGRRPRARCPRGRAAPRRRRTRPRPAAGRRRPAPHRPRARRTGREVGEQPGPRRDRVEPVGPGDERLARLPLGDLGRESRPLVPRARRAGSPR